jgi:type I restriction enzyme M protein
MVNKKEVIKDKNLEQWIWDAACAIRGAKDAGKFKDYILPLIFVKRLCDVFDDEVNKIAKNVGSRTEALKRIDADHSRVRFYLSIRSKDAETQDTWSVIRSLSNNIGQELTGIIRGIAANNSILDGVIDTVDYNATTRGQREIDDDRLSNLIEKISQKRLGLNDVEPDIIGRSYEYLIRKFAEGSGKTAGEFYTPAEVGMVMAYIMDAEPGMEVYDPTCGSAGLLIKCELALKEKEDNLGNKAFAPLHLFGQEYTPTSWAMAKMNMIIHDMEGDIELGDTFNNPKLKDSTGKGIKKFDLAVANPMWNQTGFNENVYTDDIYHRFPAGNPGGKADWGWIQHIFSSLKENGRAAVVLGTGSATRGSSGSNNSEKNIRKYFVDNDYIEAVILLPFNLFYNTDAPGVVYVLNKNKETKRKNKTLFINASLGFVKSKPKNLLDEQSAAAIVGSYKNFTEIKGFSRIVDKTVVADQEYILNPSRYVFSLNELKSVPLVDAEARFKSVNTLFETAEKNISSYLKNRDKNAGLKGAVVETIFGKINKECTLVPLSEYVEEYTERAGKTIYPVLSCSKIYGIVSQSEKFKNVVASKNKSNYKVVKPDMFVYDPMLLWDGSIGRNRYNYAGIVSPAYTVFSVNQSKIDIDYLQFVLGLNIMLPFYISISDGTNMRRRKAKFEDFKSLKIPIFKDDTQRAISNLIKYRLLIKEQEKNSIGLTDSLFKQFFLGE